MKNYCYKCKNFSDECFDEPKLRIFDQYSTCEHFEPKEKLATMDTSLSIKQIELLLHNSGLWNMRQDIMIPNLSWGLLNHEADFVAITKSGYLTEVEIKRSFSDLKADFKKDIFHRDERVYHFMYCLPISIKDKALHLFHENYGKIAKLYGHDEDYKYTNEFFPFILWYDDNGNLTKEPQKLSSRSGARKLFLEEIVTVSRLASLRYWDLANKVKELNKL